MNKKVWPILSLALAVILIAVIVWSLGSSFMFLKEKDADLQSELDHLEQCPENNFYHNQECVTDAVAAARIGSAIVDNMCGKSMLDIGFVTVEYDSSNRLWRVSKNYLFSTGGYTIIDQDTGEIVLALLYK